MVHARLSYLQSLKISLKNISNEFVLSMNNYEKVSVGILETQILEDNCGIDDIGSNYPR